MPTIPSGTKFIGISPNVPTPENRSSLSNSYQEIYTIDDIAQNVSSFQYEIGQYIPTEGGVVFHRYKDGSQENYVLIDTDDLSSSQIWSNIDSLAIGSSAQSSWDGLSNSNAIVSQPGHTSSAAKLCLDSTRNGKSDWYLPSIDELSLLYKNRFNVNITLSGNSSYGSISGAVILQISSSYWSSTEGNSTSSWYQDSSMAFFLNQKFNTYYVRAVRKFNV